MKAILLLASLSLVFGRLNFQIDPIDMSNTEYAVESHTFDNLIDHFNNLFLGTYKQRYWSLMNFFDPYHPRAILYICGEGPGRFPSEKTLPFIAGKEAKAAIFALEHRFYGKSQPTDSWFLSDLSLLTHEQGLADIAYFIESKNKEFVSKSRLPAKWVVIGGSYAGAMSAWFRYKYPHLAAGAISSSGVVDVIADFNQYELQMTIDLDKCPERTQGSVVKQLRSYHDYADSQLYDPEKAVAFMKLFNATGTSVLEFQYYFADLSIAWIQVGKRITLCKILKDLAESNKPVVEQIKKLADLAFDTLGHSIEDYKFDKLKNVDVNDKDNMRQWNFQVCSHFGWFQTAYPKNNIRSLKVNMTYWKEYCKAIYEQDDLFPDDALTNNFMGGREIAKHVTNVFFTQGSEDGWQWAGLTKNEYNNSDIEVKVITCDKCSHCIDLKAQSDTDPQELKDVRKKEIEAIKKWLS